MDNLIDQKSSRRILIFYSNHIKLSELGRFTKQMNTAVVSCNIWTCCHCSLSPYSQLSIPPMSSVMVNCHDLGHYLDTVYFLPQQARYRTGNAVEHNRQYTIYTTPTCQARPRTRPISNLSPLSDRTKPSIISQVSGVILDSYACQISSFITFTYVYLKYGDQITIKSWISVYHFLKGM